VVTSTPPMTPTVVVPTPEQASDTEVSEVPTPYQAFDTEVSAFNKRLVEKKWFIRGQKDILKVFTNYREKVNNAVTRALKKHQLKIDLVIKVRMSRQDQEGEQQEVSQAFYGGPRLILRADDFDEAYDESVKKIWGDFDQWLSHGSGWILERVENLYLNSAAYDPIYGRSYIPTPKGIAAKKAVVNIQNKDNQCFKWAVLSALHPLTEHSNRVVNYKKFENELDFTGISFPVMLDDIPKFEKQNDLAISVYTIAEHGKQVYPILYTKRRDIDPINLLLIEGDEKFHYTWIKNYDRLLSHDLSNPKVFCPYCCYGFTKTRNGIENLRKPS